MIPIKDYEDRYTVYEDGAIYSCITNKFLTPQKTRDGYYRVTLFNGKSSKRYTVHRIVAEAFLLKRHNETMVNHKDGNKGNNSLNNLEWVTPSQNARHAIDNNLYKRSKRGKCPSPEVKEKILSMKDKPINTIATTLNLNRKSVKRILDKNYPNPYN